MKRIIFPAVALFLVIAIPFSGHASTGVFTNNFFNEDSGKALSASVFLSDIYCKTLGSWFNDNSCQISQITPIEEVVTNTVPSKPATKPSNSSATSPTDSYIKPSVQVPKTPSKSPKTSSIQPITNIYTSPISYITSNTDTSNFVTKDFFNRQVDSVFNSVGKSISASAGVTSLSSFTTSNLTEGSNLYFSDARVGSYISGSSTVPHIAGNAYGNLLYWTGSMWNTIATSSLGITSGTSYTNSDANAYIHASTTIPKTYTANTFTGAQTFNGSNIFGGATTFNSTLTVGSLTGPLQAINGVVSASSTLSVAYGGTGQTSFGQGWLGINNSGAFISSTSPTVNYITATSTATSTFGGSIFSAGNIDCNNSCGGTDVSFQKDKGALSIKFANAGQIRIGTVGDSMIYNKSSLLTSMLAKMYGYGGYELGWALSVAGGASKELDKFTYWMSGTYYLIPSGGTATLLLPTDGISSILADTLKAYYINEPGGGTFKLQYSRNTGSTWIDVAGYTSINTNAATSSTAVEIATTTGYIQFRAVGISGSSHLIGLGAYLTEAGNVNASPGSIIQIGPDAMARGGSSLANIMTVPTSILNPVLASLKPDGLIFEEKNEIPATQYADMTTLLSRMTTAVSGVATTSWIFLGSTPSTGGTDLQQTATLKRFARDNQQAFVNQYYLFGNSLTVAQANGMMSGDNTHPTTEGFKAEAAYIIQNSILGLNYAKFPGSTNIRTQEITTQALSNNPSGVVNYNGATNWYASAPALYNSSIGFRDNEGGNPRFSIMAKSSTDSTYPNWTTFTTRNTSDVVGIGDYGFMFIGAQAGIQTSANLKLNAINSVTTPLWVNLASGQTANSLTITSNSTAIGTNILGYIDNLARLTMPTVNTSSTTATSTFANGINMTGGCLTYNGGACITTGGAGSGTVSSGTYGQLAWYATDGTTVSATGTQLTVGNLNATSTTATSTFAGGITGPNNFTVQSSSGFVGIGMAPLTQILTLRAGTAGFMQFGNFGCGSDYAAFSFNSTVANCGTYNFLSGGGDKNLYINRPTGNDVVFRENNSSTGAVIFKGTTNFVGVGTVSPLSRLGVAGNLAVGNAYGLLAAPTNGLLVEGNTGLGTTSPFAKLSVHANNGETNTTLFAIASSTATATSTLFSISNTGIFTASTTNSSAATSTINGNLYVNGTLRSTLSYVGDLFFANNFSFAEAPLNGTTQGLLLRNQRGQDALTIDENGNLSLVGDVCYKGKQCFGKSINELESNMNALASTTSNSLFSNQSTTASLSELTASLGNVNQTLINLGTRIDTVSSTTIQALDIKLSALTASTTFLNTVASSTASLVASSTADRLASSTPFLGRILVSFMDFLTSATAHIMSVFVGDLHIENKLCVDDVCINKDQLKALLITASSTTQAISTESMPAQPANKVRHAVIAVPTTTPVTAPISISTTTPIVASSTSQITSLSTIASTTESVISTTTPPVSSPAPTIIEIATSTITTTIISPTPSTTPEIIQPVPPTLVAPETASSTPN